MRDRMGRIVGLVIVTVFALGAAFTAMTGSWGEADDREQAQATVAIPPTPVTVMEARSELIEITDRFSGMIRPMERFSLGFEIAGRLVALGVNAEGKPLDEGDRVTAGQVLARLDDRTLRARVNECDAILGEARAQVEGALARLEQAQSDFSRSEDLRRAGDRMITQAQYQADVTKVAVTKADVAIARATFAKAESLRPTAMKNLEDATLVTSVDGVISRRHVNVGESVGPHQAIMEIIQVEEVLLVVGVPEAYVSEIEIGQHAHVELLARDRFRRERPRGEGRVYRVAEAADRTTGLFEVEIKLPNSNGTWRPGLIALAHIVLKEIEGFRIPITSVVVRDGQTFLFTVGQATEDGKRGKARRLPLEDWIEQDTDLILSELSPQDRTIVTRGQHRLVDGRDVLLVRSKTDDEH